jgi:hypothetical protein
MALHQTVPSDLDAVSIYELANDCRAVASVLASSVIDLTTHVVSIPLSRVPLDRLPFSFGAMPVEITEDLLVTVSGLEDY